MRPTVARIGAVVRGLRPSQITLPLENNAKVERAGGVTALVRATECLLRSDQVSSLAQDHAILRMSAYLRLERGMWSSPCPNTCS